MKRKDFIKNTALASMAMVSSNGLLARNFIVERKKKVKPLAIAMWDFSWLERRWDGAGYEDWDKALDELTERGYNAVRIDAYPHLVATDSTKEWELKVLWTQFDWGSPAPVKVSVQPALNDFIRKCKQRNIKVALSSWYREDADNTRMKITSPQVHAQQWIDTLKTIAAANLLDAVLYVDLCNEWPGDLWAPYFKNDPPEKTWGYWHTGVSLKWMKEAIALVKSAFPELPYCFSNSFSGNHPEADVGFMDFNEPHIWLSGLNNSEFKNAIGYETKLFEPTGLNNLAANAERAYNSKPEYWKASLAQRIKEVGAYAKKVARPLITTECWAVVDAKDYPMFHWGWVKELCETGVTAAAATGQWAAMATSNFCGPQFKGMWKDAAWHKRMTGIIKEAEIAEAMDGSVLLKRMKDMQ